jgi:hypothetical protein
MVIRTLGRNDRASVGLEAPGESGLDGGTRATVIMGSTALGNLDAGF